MSPLVRCAAGLMLAAALLLALGAACANHAQVFLSERVIAFVDADCYARMTRVRELLDHRNLLEHAFENYPFGVRPHTTLPLDFLILAFRSVLRLSGSVRATDLAGAWISPLLGALTVAGLWWWGERERLPARWAMLLLVASSPIVAHGFALGRPDHQSLIMACTAAALAAEWSFWRRPSVATGIASGVAWALGLWTSFYEPGVLLLLTMAAGFSLNRSAMLRRERLPGIAAAIAVLAVAAICERGAWPVLNLPDRSADGFEYFAAWSRQIGELRSITPWSPSLWSWTGWGMAAAPVLLLREREEAPLARAQLLLLVSVFVLTCCQARWGYFLAIVYACGIPWQYRAISSRYRPLAAAIFLLGLYPWAREWKMTLQPPPEMAAALAEQREDTLLLNESARFIAQAAQSPGQSPEAAGILAPWWLSPALAYWSGQPAIAGSSHESLPGIVDVARFFVSRADSAEAAAILRRRRVRWVVAYEPDRALSTAASLLEQPQVPARAMALILYQRPENAPRYLRLALVNPYFKIYEVLSAYLPP